MMPTAEVENAYFDPLMQWRSSVNSTADSPFFGVFAQSLALAGESPGLTPQCQTGTNCVKAQHAFRATPAI